MKNKAFKRSLRQDIAMIVRGYKTLYEICPKNMIYRTFYCIICTVIPYFPLFMSARLIDEIAAGASLNRLLILAGITVLVTLAMQLVQHIAWRKADTLETINWKLNFLYFLKIQCKMQYKHFEDPETALLMEKIRSNENYGDGLIHRLRPSVSCRICSYSFLSRLKRRSQNSSPSLSSTQKIKCIHMLLILPFQAHKNRTDA